MFKKTGWGFALIALILGGCIYFLTTGKFNLGIDLRGGTELVYQLDLSRVEGEAATVADQVKTIIAQRLDIYGLKEISIAIQGNDRLVVQVPGAADSGDVEQIRRQIEEAGNLKFMLVAKPDMQTEDHIKEIQDAERKYDAEYRAWVQRKQEFISQYRAKKEEPPEYHERAPDEPEFIARPEVESVEVPGQTGRVRMREVRNRWGNMLAVLYNGEQYKVDGNFLSRAVETYDENGRPAVAFGFRPEAATKFANLTGPHVGDNLAIVLDEKVRQVARIQSRIYDSGQLTGSFSRQEVRGIVTLLKGGSLDAKPQLISQSTVGA